MISGSCHDDAHSGCSCRKNLPATICISYSSAMNVMCTLALFNARFLRIGSPFAAFRRCQVEKAVHIGLPMMNIGRVLAMISLAFCLISGLSKSQ